MQELLLNPRHPAAGADVPRATFVPLPGDEREEATAEDEVLAEFDNAGASAAAPRAGFVRRLTRDRRASLIAFCIAFSLHAAAVTVGLRYYKSISHYEPPQLVLPKGWATEFDGAGDAGAPSPLLQPAPPLDLPKPDPAATAAAHNLLTIPPGEFEPAAVSPPAVTLDPNRGTADLGPLPTLAGDTAAPLVNFHSPPGGGATRSEPSDPSANRATIAPGQRPADTPDGATGSAPSGAGAGDGGGPEGVPDGLPVPAARNKRPTYPDLALRHGWTGTAYLELDLDAAGRVTAARLLRSSGHDVLDQAALEAARTWRYSPATLNGRPVGVTVPVPVKYDLESRR